MIPENMFLLECIHGSLHSLIFADYHCAIRPPSSVNGFGVSFARRSDPLAIALSSHFENLHLLRPGLLCVRLTSVHVCSIVYSQHAPVVA